jgi:hypothetical protein
MRHTALICAGAVLLSTLAVSRGANCTAMFAGLGTCAVLNGVPASGTPVQLGTEAMALLDEAVVDGYILDSHSSGAISNSQSCQEIYTQFHCVRLTATSVASDAGAAYKFAAPCNDTGARMLPCYDWCTEYLAACVPTLPRRYRADLCTTWTAPRAAACFGSNGRLGMKPAVAPGTQQSGANALQGPGSMGLLVIAVIYYLSY